MSKRSNRRPTMATARAVSELLERRQLLCGVVSTAGDALRIDEGSFTVHYTDDPGEAGGPEGNATITWTNRGSAASDSDNFQNVFGANAATARNVVDQAIINWTRVVSEFNQTG